MGGSTVEFVTRRGFTRALAVTVAVCALVQAACAQTVTFETYPAEATVFVGSGTPNGMSPIGQANEPIDLNSRYEKSILKIIITAEGRKPWNQSFTSGELLDGTYKERIYLHPINPLAYLIDFPLVFPEVFVAVVFLLLATGGYYLRVESGKRKVLRREQALLALGKEFEKEYGDYLGISFIGQGAMGVVEKGVRKDRLSPDSVVAIKTILKRNLEASSAEEKENSVDRFRREAKILQSTNHPNVPPLYDWGEREKELYIVMEYLDGQDLADYLSEQENCRLPLSEVRQIFSQISSALDYLHQRGVFHRDLKPANIQRTKDGRIKILDFGLAISPQASKQITKAGQIMGTLDYMAPEALQGEKPDASYDQFAVGVILFEMLTGTLPLEGVNQPMLGDYLQPRRSVKESGIEVNDEIAAVVDKMLSLKPEDRFESVKAAFVAFEQACDAVQCVPAQS